MIQLPPHLYKSFLLYCTHQGVRERERADYLKWLRYFLDFCEKYHIVGEDSQRTRSFQDKLCEKRQPEEQRRQAAHAVSLYFAMLKEAVASQPPSTAPNEMPTEAPSFPDVAKSSVSEARKSFYVEAGYQEKSGSPEWDEVLAKLAAEIKVRHYSRKTLQTYAKWSRQFQRFLKNKPPEELSTADVKEYLTYLAVECHVAASTQNQAFNSLLFLFRHSLKRDFGELRGVPRAKKYNFRFIGCRL